MSAGAPGARARTLRNAFAALLFGATLGYVGYSAWVEIGERDAAPAGVVSRPDIGGDFALVDQFGRPTTSADLHGKVVLLFFGYTHCPDICPATLHAMTRVKAGLGADAARFRGVFVTVDPARDTPQRLREYVGHFDPDFVALTGTEAQIAEVARRFGAAFEIGEPQGAGGYAVGHTTFGYLIDADGRVETLYPSGASPQDMLEGVRRLLDGPG